MIALRSDGRLGLALPTGAALDHVCPVCDGEPDHPHCYCDGLGVITAEQAIMFAEGDADPRWHPRPLAAVPEYTGRRCGDCAFKAGSLERDGASARELFAHLMCSNDAQPFYCHAGMHHGLCGYVPRQRDAHGAPVGHPICAGWVREYERFVSRWGV